MMQIQENILIMVTFMESNHVVKIQIQHFILQRYVGAIKGPLSLVLCELILAPTNILRLDWLTTYVKKRRNEVHNQMMVSTYCYETPKFFYSPVISS